MAEFEDRTYPASDATPLPMRVWRPAAGQGGAAPSVIIYLHGIQSHLGWYESSSRRLAAAGVAVYQVERRGSGRDEAHPRGHVDAAETWVRDVHAAAESACRETRAEAVHLMGVSWGGKLALAAAADRPQLYRSLIMAAPGIFAKIGPPAAVKLRIALALATGRPEKRFPIPLSDPHLFTENPERVRYVAADPLSLRDVTARFLFESRRLDRLARRAARGLRSPTLLALAEEDRIIDNAATLRLYWSLGVRRRVKVYAAAHHTLEFEVDPGEYFRDVVEWVTEIQSQLRM
jgi:acylglycerol lipase